MVRIRKTVCGLGSIPENEVEKVKVSDEQNLMEYAKPVSLYEILQTRFDYNPYFLQKCLNHEIQAKKENKPNSCDGVIFNYMDRKRKILESQVVKNYFCTFCLRRWGDIKSLHCHLKSSHGFFDFEVLEKEDKLVVDITMSPDEFKFGALEKELEKKRPFNFCSKRRKQRPRDYFNNKKSHIRILEMEVGDSSHAVEMRLSHVNDPSKADQSPEKTTNQSNIAQSSNLRCMFLVRENERSGKRIDNLKKQQFYHSGTYQPMSSEETAYHEERMRFGDRFPNVYVRRNKQGKVGEFWRWK